MSKPRRIGILGGTFDPLHKTHCDMASAASDALGLDLVLFVVSARPPHKTEGPYATAEERLEMVQAALDGEPRMKPCNIELGRNGVSYTDDTLRELQRIHPGADLFLIVGFDMLLDFPSWKNPKGILEKARLAVVPRAGMPEIIPRELMSYCQRIPFERTALSSTEIRRRIAAGESFDELVPRAVAGLIRRRGIYQTCIAVRQCPRADEFIALLYEGLSEKTRRHCLGTAEIMVCLTEHVDISLESAVTAGLLHDFGKRIKGTELIEAARRYGLVLTEVQMQNPKLLHAQVAAEECRRHLGVSDEEVYEAISWHTTGCPGLCTLGLALYVADFSELTRTFPEAATARDILREKGFWKALMYVSEEKLVRVRRKHAPVDPISQAFHSWLQHECKDA